MRARLPRAPAADRTAARAIPASHQPIARPAATARMRTGQSIGGAKTAAGRTLAARCTSP